MSVDEGHAVRPIEWIQGLDGWQELVDTVKNGVKQQKEQVSKRKASKNMKKGHQY